MALEEGLHIQALLAEIAEDEGADEPGGERSRAVAGPRAGRPREAALGAGVVVVDKPAGWTSHDLVNRVREALGTRRVGHAGTLDPAATGVMVCAIGSSHAGDPFSRRGRKGVPGRSSGWDSKPPPGTRKANRWARRGRSSLSREAVATRWARSSGRSPGAAGGLRDQGGRSAALSPRAARRSGDALRPAGDRPRAGGSRGSRLPRSACARWFPREPTCAAWRWTWGARWDAARTWRRFARTRSGRYGLEGAAAARAGEPLDAEALARSWIPLAEVAGPSSRGGAFRGGGARGADRRRAGASRRRRGAGARGRCAWLNAGGNLLAVAEVAGGELELACVLADPRGARGRGNGERGRPMPDQGKRSCAYWVAWRNWRSSRGRSSSPSAPSTGFTADIAPCSASSSAWRRSAAAGRWWSPSTRTRRRCCGRRTLRCSSASPEEKRAAMEAAGVDALAVVRFDRELAQKTRRGVPGGALPRGARRPRVGARPGEPAGARSTARASRRCARWPRRRAGNCARWRRS